MNNASNAHSFLGGPLTGKTHRLIRACLDDPSSLPLVLSFYEANAEYIRRTIAEASGKNPSRITTMQRFIFSLLRDHAAAARLEDDATAISAVSRTLVIRQAWEATGGTLWRKYRNAPGATEEITRVIDWISANRTRFTVGEGELSEHELSRIYACYIDLCIQHHLLTFQESTLRALDLLSDGKIIASLHRRFPMVCIDDLHLARPDQLAVIDRLRNPEGIFMGTAWLREDHADPALRHIWETIRIWGTIERLTESAVGVNPVIHRVISRLDGSADHPVPTDGEPVRLFTRETVEEESATVVRNIVDAFGEDPDLKPEDVVVVCADAGLKRFIHRHLERSGVLCGAAGLSHRQNPLIRAGLLIVRWHDRGPDPETVRRLLRLPFLDLDVLDLDMMERHAREHGRLILDTHDVAELPLRDPKILTTMAALRQCLSESDRSRPLSDRIHGAVSDLGALQWVRGQNAFPAGRNAFWESAYTAWIDSVLALEKTAGMLGFRARDLAPHIERLADQLPGSAESGGVKVLDAQETQGVRGRMTCVVGLSENAVPRMENPLQLLEESELAGLFAEGAPVVLPALREQAAWIERESRRLAVMLSRGSNRLCISVSRYTAGGDAQLPTPFFDTLLGEAGEIDRDGRIEVHNSPLWRHERIEEPHEGARVPVITPMDPPSSQGRRVLRGHIFSASQMRTYLRCPLQFFYDRVLRLDSDESHSALLRGSLLHEVLCAALGDGRTDTVDLLDRPRPVWMDDDDRLTQRAHAVLEAAWTGRPAELPEGGLYTPEEAWEPRFGPTLQRNAVRRWAMRVLRRWAEFEVEGRGDDATPRRPVLLETAFDIQVGEHYMIGRIDRVDEVIIDGRLFYDVIDYKTGHAGADSLAAQIRKFLPDREEDAPTDYQLPIYGLALHKGVGTIRAMPRMLTYINLDRIERAARGRFRAESMRSVHLVDRSTVDSKLGFVPLSLLTGHLSEAINTTLDAMSSSPYPATPGFYCAMCGFRSACSRGRAYVGEN